MSGVDGLEIRHARERFFTERAGLTTYHCFSFGDHYDPDRTGVGSLIALNDERLAPGAGYQSHKHTDVEIVTWVLQGTLLHEDSMGGRATVRRGSVQRLTAGAGAAHSEVNADASGEELRFIQLWFTLGGLDVPPSYETYTPVEDDDPSGLALVARSGTPRQSLALGVSGVEVRAGHVRAGTSFRLFGTDRSGDETFSYIVQGRFETRSGDVLSEGDGVVSSGPGLFLTAAEEAGLVCVSFRPTDLGR